MFNLKKYRMSGFIASYSSQPIRRLDWLEVGGVSGGVQITAATCYKLHFINAGCIFINTFMGLYD